MKPADEEFRAVGFTGHARNFPRDELAIKMLAAWCGYPVEMMPDALKFHANESTMKAWARVAETARDHFASKATG